MPDIKELDMLYRFMNTDPKEFDKRRQENWRKYVNYLADNNFQEGDEIPSFAEFVLIIKKE